MGKTKVHPLQKAKCWTLFTRHGRQPYVTVTCNDCGATEDMNCQVNNPPHFIANKFRRRGWQVVGEGKRARCPKCVRSKPLSTPLEIPEIQLKPEPVEKPVATKPPEYEETFSHTAALFNATMQKYKMTSGDLCKHSGVSTGTAYRLLRGQKSIKAITLATVKDKLDTFDKARTAQETEEKTPMTEKPSREAMKKQRMLYTLLEDHYDEDRSAYADDWSDAKVAEQVGLAVSHVADIREASFGPIGDPAVTALEVRIEALRKEIAADHADLAKIVKETMGGLQEKVLELDHSVQTLRKARA